MHCRILSGRGRKFTLDGGTGQQRQPADRDGLRHHYCDRDGAALKFLSAVAKFKAGRQGPREGKYVCEGSQLLRESRCAEDDVMLRGDEGYLGCNDVLVPT